MRVNGFGRSIVLALALLAVLLPFASHTQVYPSAPQSATSSDGVDAAGMVKVLSTAHGGVGGFLDVTGYSSCRYVTDGLPAGNDELIPIDSLTDWRAWLNDPGQGDSQVVCCRPQTVTLCKVAGATPKSLTLPYTIYGQAQQPVAECVDEWGDQYKDVQTWTCGQAGVGVTADGKWQQQGGDSYTCSPNAFTTGCSASCPQTVGTTTTYDSCGNVQSVNSCSISCCTTNWVKTSCSGPTATYTDEGSCHSGSYSTPNSGCTQESSVFTCAMDYPDWDGNQVFFDCGPVWQTAPIPSGASCSPNGPTQNVDFWEVCATAGNLASCPAPGPNTSGRIAAVDSETCEWWQ